MITRIYSVKNNKKKRNTLYRRTNCIKLSFSLIHSKVSWNNLLRNYNLKGIGASHLQLRRLGENIRRELLRRAYTSLDLNGTSAEHIMLHTIIKQIDHPMKGTKPELNPNSHHLRNAIWGFNFPDAIARKSLSVNENVASGFPS